VYPNEAAVYMNGICCEIGHFQAEDLLRLRKARELKTHAAFTEIDQPAKAIAAEKDEYDLREDLS